MKNGEMIRILVETEKKGKVYMMKGAAYRSCLLIALTSVLLSGCLSTYGIIIPANEIAYPFGSSGTFQVIAKEPRDNRVGTFRKEGDTYIASIEGKKDPEILRFAKFDGPWLIVQQRYSIESTSGGYGLATINGKTLNVHAAPCNLLTSKEHKELGYEVVGNPSAPECKVKSWEQLKTGMRLIINRSPSVTRTYIIN